MQFNRRMGIPLKGCTLIRKESLSIRQEKGMLCVVLGGPKDHLSTESAHNVGAI